MEMKPQLFSGSPPLRLAWSLSAEIQTALSGDGSLFGVTSAGKLVAIALANGAQRWEAPGTYLPHRLARQGTRLFAFKLNEGLAFIDDAGNSATERLVLSFGATAEAKIANPVVDDRLVYLAVNAGLYVLHQEEGLQFATVLATDQPHTMLLVASRDIVTIDGVGIPRRYRIMNDRLELVWTGAAHGASTGHMEHPAILAGNRIIVGVGRDVVAYDLANGRIAWQRTNTPAGSLTTDGTSVYVGFHGAALWSLRLSDGAMQWQRQHVYNLALQGRYFGVAVAGDHVYFGSTLRTNPDGALLLAVRKADGAFVWISRAASQQWTGGIPLVEQDALITYGAASTGAYRALNASPRVLPEHIEVTPRPLRGAAAGFGPGLIRVNMPVAARVSLAFYRESQGRAPLLVNGASWGAGMREVNWSPGGSGGYTATQQFGYLLMDVEEASGTAYTQSLLVPVNTFPDILYHWAAANIETMVFNKYVSGYPDQTFRPDFLVTRAESSVIIAKTLGMESPSPGFQSKLTDIRNHWARAYIMALEEQGIIGGFAEPDGTFTFRPELNMTRAQEARILVRAYAIPAAPPGFATRFMDIAGHWAEADIRALEAAGYVNGFPEGNGRFTYRPEQSLTRAELCTVLVRIRGL